MKVLTRLLGALAGLFLVTAVAGVAAAQALKERIVRRENPMDDEVALAAILEPVTFRSSATSFRGGTLDCWYGGGVVDLRGATLAPEGATLRLRTIFGGAQVLVPDAWRIETAVSGIGGVGDNRPAQGRADDAPVLRLEGLTLFGGIGVSSATNEGTEKWMREIEKRSRRPASAAPDAAEAAAVTSS
jgi:hypothetical protein